MAKPNSPAQLPTVREIVDRMLFDAEQITDDADAANALIQSAGKLDIKGPHFEDVFAAAYARARKVKGPKAVVFYSQLIDLLSKRE